MKTFVRSQSRTAVLRCIGPSIITTVVQAMPITALAAGFQIAAQNASGLGSVFAGQAAVADDASVVWFNPAGLPALGTRPQVAVAGQFVASRSAFSDSGSCTPYLGAGAGTSACPFGRSGNLGHAAGGEGDRDPATAAIPNLYASLPIVPGRLWAGFGINAPFGLKNEYGNEWVGRFQTIESKTTTVNLNPSVAAVAGPVSVGIGIDAQRFDARLSNAVSYSAVAFGSGIPALIGAVGPGREGVSQLKGRDWGYGWNAGVAVDAFEGLRAAVTYRSAIRHTLRGNIRFDARPAALDAVPQLADGGAEAAVRLPSQFSIAVQWKPIPAIALLADWSRTNWSAIQELRVVRTDGPLAGSIATSTPLQLKDSRRVGVGAAWRIDDRFLLRAGVARESSSVDDRYRTPLLPDSDRILYGIGGRFGWSPTSAIDLGVLWVRASRPTVEVPNQTNATALPRGSLNGSLATSAFVIGGQWSYGF